MSNNKLERGKGLIAAGLRLLAGTETLVVNDWELAHGVLRDSSFTKTSLEVDFVGRLLTVGDDERDLGSPFAHRYADEDWAESRSLTSFILTLSGEGRSEKTLHRNEIRRVVQSFLAKKLAGGARIDLDGNDLGHQFANEYMMSLLFKDADALGSEKSKELLRRFSTTQLEIFILYLVSQRGTRLASILNPILWIIARGTEAHFTDLQNKMIATVKEALADHPDSYFSQAMKERAVHTDVQVGQAFTLMVAGGETMGGSIAFGLRELAVNDTLAEDFFSGKLSTLGFVTHIVNMFPPSDVFRLSPDEDTIIGDTVIPAKAILRMNPDNLFVEYQKSKGQPAPLNESFAFGGGDRICAGMGNATAQMIIFFDELKNQVSHLEWLGTKKQETAVNQNLSRLPAVNKLRFHRKK